jgi:hypothetical protein
MKIRNFKAQRDDSNPKVINFSNQEFNECIGKAIKSQKDAVLTPKTK